VVSQSQTNRLFFSKFNPRSFAVAHELPQEYRTLLDKPRECRAGADAKLLWVGRLDPYKHPEDAVEILAGVRKSVPEATLTYVGKSADGVYEREIMARADELGIASAITFAGFKSDVTRYYEEADALILTTEVEGYCLVLAEALATGLPVVAYDLPYLPFAHCAGVAWVAQSDVRAAAAAVSALLEDDSRWKNASSAAQAFMREGLLELMPTTWADVLDSLRNVPCADALAVVESERVMWDALLAHYLAGERKVYAQLEERRKTADIAASERDDVLQSHAYNVGKTLIAPLRLARSIVSKKG
ncbi:MAG: glycosyltransferase, partial [Eggerthellaceae bacterium]|nr:glycosyltransferase [Eggerthellaceae bacterium]